jgi:hypothetical protein
MFRVSDGPTEPVSPRVEELEVLRGDPDSTLQRFLAACEVPSARAREVEAATARAVRQFRAALVRVSQPRGGPRVEVVPANVERLDGVERRRAAV